MARSMFYHHLASKERSKYAAIKLVLMSIKVDMAIVV